MDLDHFCFQMILSYLFHFLCKLAISSNLTVQGPDDSERLQSDLNVLQEWEKKWDVALHNLIPYQVQYTQRECLICHALA